MDRQALRTSVAVVALLLASLYVSSATDCSPPEITGDSIVVEGNLLTLQCSCNGSNWTLNGHALPGDAFVDDDGSLTVDEADHDAHDGYYVCAVNGVSSAQFRVTVQYIASDISICEVYDDGELLPGTLSDLNNFYFYTSFVGSNITLKCCPPAGEPTPTISWDLHNEFSNDVRYSQNNSQLVIDSLQAFGEFTCTATNPAGSRTSDLIHLLAGIPIYEDEITVFTPRPTACVKQGGDVEIRCIVNGPVDTTVTWQLDELGTVLGPGGRAGKFHVDNEYTLSITNVQPIEASIYTCGARADGFESRSVKVEVNLNCIRSVILQPQVVTIGMGHSVTLTCNVSKLEYLLSPITITWTTPTGMTYTGKTLTVDNIQYRDGGIYNCTTSTKDAPSHNSTNIVYVEGPPTVEIVTNKREAMLNYPFVLTCHTNGTHKPRFTWYHDETRITSHVQHFSNYSVFDISRFNSSHIGSYKCVVRDGIHLPVESSFEVVLTKDIYLFSPGDLGNQEVIINDSLRLSCHVIGGEGRLNVMWYNGSTPLVDSDKTRIVNRTESWPSTLTINYFSLSDEGQYSCVANDEMSRMFSHSFRITVNIPATLVDMSPPDVTKEIGSWVELQCVVDGKPRPEVNWTKGIDINLSSNNRRIVNHTNGSLIIPYVTAEDEDTYSCLFKNYIEVNQFKTEFKEFRLNVVPRQEEETTDGNEILGLQMNVFIAVILGAVGGFFILLTCLLIVCVCCSKCVRRLKNRRPSSPVTRLEVTTFERRPSMRGSTRKDNSGILQSRANARWSLSSDAHSNTNTVAMTTASSSLAISPAPPVPSPVPPPAGPTASLATEVVLPPGVSNFPRQNLKLGNVMGEGEFGPVYRAIARRISPKEEESIVAVKILMPREGDEDYQPEMALADFASQMKLSSDYVASIVGICADTEPYYVIYQYLSEGDLKQYLTTHRPSPQLQPMLTQVDLMHIITQVSHGMSYLYSQQIIHGDLASRNCLIGADLSIKIADLGIGHDLYPNDYYDNGTQLLPIRWMAPELLIESTEGPAFSLASDVWAFGIFCWEVFTYGCQPYHSMSDSQVLRLVPHGHTLSTPEEGCPPLLFSLMQDCWSASPEQRPSFSEITNAVLNIDVD